MILKKQLSEDRHIIRTDNYKSCIINNNGKVISQDFNSISILSSTTLKVKIDNEYYITDYDGNILKEI